MVDWRPFCRSRIDKFDKQWRTGEYSRPAPVFSEGEGRSPTYIRDNCSSYLAGVTNGRGQE